MIRDQRGAAAVEVAILAPMLLLLLAVMLVGGRLISTKGNLSAIAREAVRAASQEADSDSALLTAEEIARHEADVAGLDPERLQLDLRVGDFSRGGRISATVSYQVRLSDLPGFGLLPSSFTVTAKQVETIERHKSR